MLEGLRQANAPAELIESLTKQAEAAKAEEVEIWEDNRATVRFFFAISTQWLVSGMGEYIGLDHRAIESTMNMMSIRKPKRRTLLAEIKIMEAAALEVIRERKKE